MIEIEQQKVCSVSSTQGKLILSATILASGLAYFSSIAVSVALPTLQTHFDATFDKLQWIVNSFTLALTVLLMVGGSLSDIFGRKRIFLWGMVVFALGALLSGFAQTVNQLIFFQAVKGVGAAFMIPGSLAILNACFKESEKGKVFGLWAGISGAISGLGPLLGGILIQTLGWQAMFFSNVPIALVTFYLTWKAVPESKNPHATKIDYAGTVAISIALFCISFGLIQAPIVGWNHITSGYSLIVGIISLIAFFGIEKRVKEPMVPLQMFKNKNVLGANIFTLLLYFALNGLFFFIVINFQQVQGYSPIMTGLGMLPPILLLTFFAGYFGSYADKHGPRTPMIVGPALVAVGMILLAFSPVKSNYFIHFFPGLFIFGVGLAIYVPALTKAAMMVEDKYSGAASGVNNAASRGASLLAIAILGSFVAILFSSNIASIITDTGLDVEKQKEILDQSRKLAGIDIPDSFSDEEKIIAKETINTSFIFAFRLSMIVSIVLAVITVVVGFFMITNEKKQ